MGGYLTVTRGDGEWWLEGDKVLVLGDLTKSGVYEPCFVGLSVATMVIRGFIHFLLKKLLVCWFY